MRSVSLLYLSAAWVSGVLLGSRVGLPLPLLALGLIPLAFVPFFRNHRSVLIAVGLCLLALIGGGLRFASSLPPANEHSLHFYNDGGTVEIRGMVAEEPDVESSYSSLALTMSACEAPVSVSCGCDSSMNVVPKSQRPMSGNALACARWQVRHITRSLPVGPSV